MLFNEILKRIKTVRQWFRFGIRTLSIIFQNIEIDITVKSIGALRDLAEPYY